MNAAAARQDIPEICAALREAWLEQGRMHAALREICGCHGAALSEGLLGFLCEANTSDHTLEGPVLRLLMPAYDYATYAGEIEYDYPRPDKDGAP